MATNRRLPLAVLGLSLVAVSLRAGGSAPSTDRAPKARECAALRMSYAASAAYNPYVSLHDISTQCAERLENKDYAKAVAFAEQGLRLDRYNIHLLMLKAAALRAAGDSVRADETRALWFGLIDSILASGDGRGFETAYRVISVDEEYALLKVLRLKMTAQKLAEHQGSEFDILAVTDARSGDAAEVYFNIDLAKGWLNRHLAAEAAPASPAAPSRSPPAKPPSP